MRKNFTLLLAVVCLLACSKTRLSSNAANENQAVSNQTTTADTVISSPPPKAVSPNLSPVPKVSDFSIQTFFRHSDKKDFRADRLPPFVYGEINFFVESANIKAEDSITAIWLETDEENLTLKAKTIKRVPFLKCDAEMTGSEVEFGKITERQLLEMKAAANRSDDQPFDFFLIYPAVKNARKLKKAELTKAMLPESVEVEQVVLAVDLNDDGDPDLLIGNYCCYDSSQCDCTNKYQKINAEWKYLGGSEPC